MQYCGARLLRSHLAKPYYASVPGYCVGMVLQLWNNHASTLAAVHRRTTFHKPAPCRGACLQVCACTLFSHVCQCASIAEQRATRQGCCCPLHVLPLALRSTPHNQQALHVSRASPCYHQHQATLQPQPRPALLEQLAAALLARSLPRLVQGR